MLDMPSSTRWVTLAVASLSLVAAGCTQDSPNPPDDDDPLPSYQFTWEDKCDLFVRAGINNYVHIHGCRVLLGEWDASAGGSWEVPTPYNATGFALGIEAGAGAYGQIVVHAGDFFFPTSLYGPISLSERDVYAGRTNRDNGTIEYYYRGSVCHVENMTLDVSVVGAYTKLRVWLIAYDPLLDEVLLLGEDADDGPTCNGWWEAPPLAPV